MMPLKPWIKRGMAHPMGQRLLNAVTAWRGMTVLMYHRIAHPGDEFHGLDVTLFGQQMAWLRRHCRVIGADDIDAALAQPDPRRNTVLLTFDDGYRDYIERAYPVLDALELPALVFLPTQFIDHGGLLWTDQVSHMVRRSTRQRLTLPWQPGRPVELPPARPGEADARRPFIERCKHDMKALDNADRLLCLQSLADALGVPLDDPELPRQMMNWHEVRACSRLTRWGGHSHTHPILSRVSTAQAEQEIRLCKERIARATGRVPTTFAYPNGRSEDFTAQTVALLRQHGFQMAFSTEPGRHLPGMNRHAVRRQPAAASLPNFVWLATVQGSRG
jgi:peptidoglycan/xylan/chitin deacetylase (PgdA/CDA1 family)